MCGIAGIFGLSQQRIENLDARIDSMTRRLRHRGPDYQGTYVDEDGRFALGNTRLAISDPGCTLPQPMVISGRGVLSFNGQLYNDLELRKDLESQSVSFQSNLDTEVLAHGLLQRGESFLHKIDGMWAFAFCDLTSGQLMLSRDLMGERQLFYRLTDSELVFASEVAPILADSGEQFDLDLGNLLSALRFGSPPPGETIVKGVKRLRAGHNLIIKRNCKAREYRFARLHPEKWFDFFAREPTPDAAIEVFEGVFSEACRRRIPREVPFISALSGGLDSAIVGLFASRFGTHRIDTLYAWSEKLPVQRLPEDLPEFDASEMTSRVIGSRHYSRRLDTHECVSVLARLADNSYDGMLDEGAASFEMLGLRARELDKKVILISDGPDEFSGGYPIDHLAYKQDNSLRSGGKATYYRPYHELTELALLHKTFVDTKADNSAVGFGVIDPVYRSLAKEMDTTQLRALAYACTSVPDYSNLRTDKGFLRSAVESRSPFLAPAIVELLVAMPARFRFDKGEVTKYFMRKIVERRIGPRVAWRSKHGFSAPLWFSSDIGKKLRIVETLRESPLLKELPFSQQFLKAPFEPPFHKLRWAMFALTRAFANLKSRSYG